MLPKIRKMVGQINAAVSVRQPETRGRRRRFAPPPSCQLRYEILETFSAAGPFAPATTSNSTRSPSSNDA
jgi:hypothetical protein